MTTYHFCIKLDKLPELMKDGFSTILDGEDGYPLPESDVIQLITQEKSAIRQTVRKE